MPGANSQSFLSDQLTQGSINYKDGRPSPNIYYCQKCERFANNGQ